jgi:hypothetical protein
VNSAQRLQALLRRSLVAAKLWEILRPAGCFDKIVNGLLLGHAGERLKKGDHGRIVGHDETPLKIAAIAEFVRGSGVFFAEVHGVGSHAFFSCV